MIPSYLTIESPCCKICNDRCCISVNGVWCKSLTPTGCKLPYQERGEGCRIYPFVEKDNELLLDLKCPHWKLFGDKYREVIR
jgi:hypothetical protein